MDATIMRRFQGRPLLHNWTFSVRRQRGVNTKTVNLWTTLHAPRDYSGHHPAQDRDSASFEAGVADIRQVPGR
jgi:hypothetical protein